MLLIRYQLKKVCDLYLQSIRKGEASIILLDRVAAAKSTIGRNSDQLSWW